jgi:hypothetical protein
MIRVHFAFVCTCLAPLHFLALLWPPSSNVHDPFKVFYSAISDVAWAFFGITAAAYYLGKGKEKGGDVRLVIVMERAERLIPELIVPLTGEFVVAVHGAIDLL